MVKKSLEEKFVHTHCSLFFPCVLEFPKYKTRMQQYWKTAQSKKEAEIVFEEQFYGHVMTTNLSQVKMAKHLPYFLI